MAIIFLGFAMTSPILPAAKRLMADFEASDPLVLPSKETSWTDPSAGDPTDRHASESRQQMHDITGDSGELGRA